MSADYFIAPSILSADFANLGAQIREAETAGADYIHIDVMDGHFAPNLTMGPAVVQACRRSTNLPLDVHLMIESPGNFIEVFAKAGATSITVHVEATPHVHGVLAQIRGHGCRVGVALNPGTAAASVGPVLSLVDLVLVMSVNPGFSGQDFIPEVLPKVREIRRELDQVNPQALIEMDGGVSVETIARSYAAGARVFSAGSSVFGHPGGIRAGIQALCNALPT